jgi:katanin p60 ATPase-containing subunit A1
LRTIDVDESVDFAKLVAITNHYSGADIANVCREAAMMPMRRILLEGKRSVREIAEMQDKFTVPLVMDDFTDAIKNTSKSVSQAQLDDYKKWMDEFGSV